MRRACAGLLACELVVGVVGWAACARPPAPEGGPEAARVDAPVVQTTSAPAADVTCLRELDEQAVAYKQLPAAGGMRTPVEIAGPIGGVALVPRGRRSAVMDCVLASALLRAKGVFQELGIGALAFSAAFDNRTRRGSSELSAHAFGLAIDVHAIRGADGEYDVRQYFERGVGLWRGLGKGPGALEACVGQPATKEGRVLKELACRLKLHPAFRVIVTPDDDADHQDHLHLEARSTFFPPAVDAPVPLPPPPAPASPPAEGIADAKRAPARRSVAKRKKPAKQKRLSKKEVKKTEKKKTMTKKMKVKTKVRS